MKLNNWYSFGSAKFERIILFLNTNFSQPFKYYSLWYFLYNFIRTFLTCIFYLGATLYTVWIVGSIVWLLFHHRQLTESQIEEVVFRFFIIFVFSAEIFNVLMDHFNLIDILDNKFRKYRQLISKKYPFIFGEFAHQDLENYLIEFKQSEYLYNLENFNLFISIKIDEKKEQERLKRDRLEQERLEKRRLKREKLEEERLKRERLEQERLEEERLNRGSYFFNQWYQSNFINAKFQVNSIQATLQNVYSNHFKDQTLTDYLYYFSGYIYYELWQNKLEVVYSEELLNFRSKQDLKTRCEDIFTVGKSLTKYFLNNFDNIEKNADQLFSLNPDRLKISGTYSLTEINRQKIKDYVLLSLSNYYLSVCYADICNNRFDFFITSDNRVKITKDNFTKEMLDLEIEKYKRLQKLIKAL